MLFETRELARFFGNRDLRASFLRLFRLVFARRRRKQIERKLFAYHVGRRLSEIEELHDLLMKLPHRSLAELRRRQHHRPVCLLDLEGRTQCLQHFAEQYGSAVWKSKEPSVLGEKFLVQPRSRDGCLELPPRGQRQHALARRGDRFGQHFWRGILSGRTSRRVREKDPNPAPA